MAMDRGSILTLISGGTAFSKLNEGNAIALLNNQIGEVYIKNGLHRTMSADKFNEEVKFCAVALYTEIMSDKAYRELRDMELHYIFAEGMKGRLGDDKSIVITYKNFLRWIEGYVKHAEYKEACRLWDEERKPKPKPLQPHVWNDDDYRLSIRSAYDKYVKYRESLSKRDVMQQDMRLKNVVTIGELIGPPLEIMDYGGIRMGWLKANGYARDGERFEDVLTRAMSNNGQFVKVL